MARAKSQATACGPVAATLDDLARAVCASDNAPAYRPGSTLASAARLTALTLALGTLGRTVHLDLGNGHRLVCQVEAIHAEGASA